jgi:hypothetical protein
VLDRGVPECDIELSRAFGVERGRLAADSAGQLTSVAADGREIDPTHRFIGCKYREARSR